MSVPVAKRSECRLEVFNKTNALAKYTIHICCNKKIFLEEYQNALTDDIISTAKDIHIKSWMANNIRVIDDDTSKERLELERESVLLCDKLLALIHMAKPLFHLSSKRIGYWGSLVMETKSFLQKWKESDLKKYKG